MSVKALLCAAILLFSVLLFPLNLNQSFPDAYAQKLDEPREKKDKDPKIDSQTLNKKNQALARKEAASAASSADDIRVILELDGKASSSDKKELTKLGIKIEGERETLIQALVPSTQLDIVAELDFIKYVRQPLYVVPASISEGVFVIGANETNAAGFTGQDIKIGVIDVGFDLDNPEIAPNIVEAISFRADGDIQTSDPRHGTAVAEIIVDVAPDVQLFLYNVDTSLSLLNALDFIANQQEVDIVSMSLGIYNAGPYDGTSEISQAVDAVRDSGVLLVNSAGNDGQRHWEGNFVDPDSNGLRNFSGDDETIGINAQAGQFVQVFLSWDDWPVSMQDYDLYVFDDDLSLVTFSENPQILGFPPTEHAEFVATSTGTYHIAISKFSATQDVTFDLFTSVNLNEHNIPSSSIAIPSDAAGAFTIGAVFWENGVLEPFSSRGPTNDGRIKPDISGPDGVTTSAFSPSAFFGTSAATPYVSGAAALVKDVYPGADADALQSLLEENTLNNHIKNNDDGTGMVNTSFLLAGIPVANAGADQTVNETSIVILDGTLSTDSDGTIVSYLWEQINGTIAVALTDASSATASFTAPSVDDDIELMFELTVTDDLGASASDTITIIVKNINQGPVANAGTDQIVNEGTLVTLNGTDSSDPDDDTLSYSWVQTSGISVELDNTTSAIPLFTAPLVGSDGDTLTFQLTVTDSGGLAGTDTVDIIVENVNIPPEVEAGPDQRVNEGSPVTLDGTSSTDLDADPLTYSWAQTFGPAVTLSGADTATPSFSAPQVDSAGVTLTFELIVSDGVAESTDTVDVIVQNINQPPVADAGSDQTENEGTVVILNATGSSDPDGDPLTYSWVQTAGPEVFLDNSTSPIPSFTTPEVESTGAVLTFELTVDDGNGGNATDTVDIAVNDVIINQPPAADAGPDQTVEERTLVALNGTGSTDPDGTIESYSWTQISGTSVELIDADTATPSFTAPEVNTDVDALTFELTVSDNNALTGTDTVNVVVQNVNQPPIADAGSDQTVNEGDAVALNGTVSSDPDGDPITYSWTQTAGPIVTLSGANSASPSFTAPAVDSTGATLTFQLTVDDGNGGSATDSVDIIVNNVQVPPIANAGLDQPVNEGTLVILDGTASSDSDGEILSYSWAQTNGILVELDDPTSATSSFLAPEVEADGDILTFELTVTDNDGLTSTDTVDIIVANINLPPVANAGPDQTVDEGSPVTLDGSASVDLDADPLTYSWAQTFGPAVTLSGADTATPSFTAPQVDTAGALLTFELTVSDGAASGTDTLDVSVNNVDVNQPPVANAGPDQTVDEGTVVTLDGTGSTDPDGDTLTYSWVQTTGPAVTLSAADTTTPSFTAPLVDSLGATLTFELTISDGAAFSTDTVNISIQNVNQAPTAIAGPDQIVDEGAIVILDGTASSDADGDTLAFSWAQTDGTLVIMSEPTSPTPSFSAPDVGTDGVTLAFELTVTDNDGLTSTDTVVIIVDNINQPPVANAGADQIVNEGTIVTLDAGSSTDPDGDELAFSWVQTAGSEVSLDDPSSATSSFTAPQVDSTGVTLTFELTVSDGDASSTDSVDVIVNNVEVNQPPVADAGSDQTVDEGALVTLNGTGSSDPDNELLTYSWVQTNGTSVELTGADTATPSFTAPTVDTNGVALTFELTVSDGVAESTDTVDVIVQNVNQLPVADAGPDQIVDELTLVNLNGTGSSDLDGDPITYSWTQTAGPIVILSGADTVAPSFTAPDVDSAGATLTFQLTVDDGNEGTATDTVDIIVQNVNQAPLAVAGADQTVDEGDVVTLNGSGSTDPDGDPIIYSWVQTTGPAAILSDTTTVAPSFTAPQVDLAGATLTFELTVTDNGGLTSTDTVDVFVQNINQMPVADAGSDQAVDEGTVVILDGTGSTDPDGDPLIYSWTQTAGPTITLSAVDVASPAFTAPEVDSAGALLTFDLTVSDGDASSTDSIDVIVQNVNQTPTANAGSDQIVDEGTVLTLNATESSDPDGDSLTFSWVQIDGPGVSLDDPTSATPSFTAPLVDSSTTITFELTVDDGNGANATDTVDILVNDVLNSPVAEAGSDQIVDEGAFVTLDGTGSTDPDGTIQSYSWIQINGTPVELTGADTATPSFTAPEVDSLGSTLIFELTVTDNDDLTNTDTVNVVVQNINQPPVADAGPDQIVDESTIVILDGTASSDADGDALAFSWVQTDGTLVVMSDPTSPTPSFSAPDVGTDGVTLAFELTVTDNDDLTNTDTMVILVENVNQPPVADSGPDQIVNEGTIVTLDAGSSTDPDGDELAFSWVQTAGPEVSLDDPSSATSSFTAPQVDLAGVTLTFELTVSDGDASSTDSVDVIVNNVEVNQPPVADAGSDQTVDEGALVTLNGTGSSDPDDDELTYSWIQLNGTSVELIDTAVPSFTAPEVDSAGAILTFELTVTDNDGLTSTDTVNVIVENINQPPVADAGPDQTVDEDAVVTLNGIGSSDPDGVIVSYSWQQESGPAVSLSNASAASTTFLAPLVDTNTILTFRLNITDNENSSATDIMSITVNNEVVTSAGSGNRGSGRTVIVTNQPPTPPFPATFFALNPLAKIIIQSTLFVDSRGATIAEASEEQQVQINSTLINQQQLPQNYIYIVQITDADGFTLEIIMQRGTAAAGGTVEVGRSWTTPATGIYTIDIFVWDSLAEAPVALSDVGHRTITVV